MDRSSEKMELKDDGKKKEKRCPGSRLARKTGLEPATTGSTGRDSNQLSYFPSSREPRRIPRRESSWPSSCENGSHPTVG